MEPRLKATSPERINNILCYDYYYLRESVAFGKEKGGWGGKNVPVDKRAHRGREDFFLFVI